MKINRLLFLGVSVFALSSCNTNAKEVDTANISALNCCYNYGTNVVTLKVNDEKIAWADDVTAEDFVLNDDLSGKSISSVERDTKDDKLLYATFSSKITNPIESKKSATITVPGKAFKRTKVTKDSTFNIDIDLANAHLNKEYNEADIPEPTSEEPTHKEHYDYYGVGRLTGAITKPDVAAEIYKSSKIDIATLTDHSGFTSGDLYLQKVKNNENGDFVVSFQNLEFESDETTDCSITLTSTKYKKIIYNNTASLKFEFTRNTENNHLTLKNSTAYFIDTVN